MRFFVAATSGVAFASAGVCSPTVDLSNLWQPNLKAESVTLDAGIDYVRSLLQTGIQVEQTVIQPYLSAKYSIHEGTNVWASSVIHSVAVEEMLHMTAAANILNAIGGHPCFNSTETVPAYPQYVSYLNLTADLMPFSPATVKVFRRNLTVTMPMAVTIPIPMTITITVAIAITMIAPMAITMTIAITTTITITLQGQSG